MDLGRRGAPAREEEGGAEEDLGAGVGRPGGGGAGGAELRAGRNARHAGEEWRPPRRWTQGTEEERRGGGATSTALRRSGGAADRDDDDENEELEIEIQVLAYI